MRRFIVETVVDGLILLVLILVMGLFTVAQPFPFGPDSAPILQLRGAGRSASSSRRRSSSWPSGTSGR